MKIRIRIFCVHEQRHIGEVGLPERPTDRPGYVRLAGTISNSHAERRLLRRFSSVRFFQCPQILLFALVAAEPTYAKLRQTETQELREARDLFLLNLREPP